jgi:hypothetical protein
MEEHGLGSPVRALPDAVVGFAAVLPKSASVCSDDNYVDR